MRLPPALCALTLALSLSAAAHDADIVFVASGREAGGEVLQRATMTGGTLSLLAPADANDDGLLGEAELLAAHEAIAAGVWESMPLYAGDARCQRLSTSERLRESYVELQARFRCPQGPLRQVYRILSVLPDGYRVILGTFGAGGTAQRFAEGTAQTLYLDAQAEGGATGPSGFLGWVWLGALHIFTGYDHLAFLAALLLVAPGLRRLLFVVTSFTLAHSITLGATALGWIELGPWAARWVEVAIAFSIVFVAAENLLQKGLSHREGITFAFGLIHGFGFATVLRGHGFGDSAVAALAGFNLGVELGQAAVVALAFPLLVRARRGPPGRARRITVAGSVVVGLAGLWWLLTRALA